MYFIINRCSFSGATLSGGFSHEASKKRCCDANDLALNNVVDYIPQDFKNKFPSVIVDKCNNRITSMKVCRGFVVEF